MIHYSKRVLIILYPVLLFCLFLQAACTSPTGDDGEVKEAQVTVEDSTAGIEPMVWKVLNDVPLRTYFEYMDTLVAHLDTTLNYEVDEYLIVWNNPWLIDSLENTDYYRLKAKGIFCVDPNALPALHKGSTLLIPDSLQAEALRRKLATTLIDINIPEFKLHVFETEKRLYSFPVRVGQSFTKL